MNQTAFNLPQPKNNRVYRFDPDMEPAQPPQPKPGDYRQKITDTLRDIALTDLELVPLEAKRDRIIVKLEDPRLADIPVDDPRRLDAQDRVDALTKDIDRLTGAMRYLIADVDAWGRYVDEADLSVLGRDLHPDLVARIKSTEPETERMPAWHAVFRNCIPF
jgi:hypothetical protein